MPLFQESLLTLANLELVECRLGMMVKKPSIGKCSDCQPNQFQIDFEIADAYILSSNSNAQIINSSPTSITIDVFNGVGAGIIEVSETLQTHSFVTIQLQPFPNDLFEIRIDSYNNNIKGDTLYLCSKFGTKPLEIIYDVNSPIFIQSECFQQDYDAKVYINNVALDTKLWEEMNIKTGDTLFVKRSSGFLPCDCGYEQFQNELKTNSYIIKLVDNEITPISDVIIRKYNYLPW